MTSKKPGAAPPLDPKDLDPEGLDPKGLDLERFALWLVERGLRGLPLDQQLAGYCQRLFDAGFPIRRAQMGMNTLHPRYGMHAFIWRPGAGAVQYAQRERAIVNHVTYLRSPVHYMRSRGVLDLRRRLDGGGPDEFYVFPELRAAGLTDYAARLVPFDPATSDAVAEETLKTGRPIAPDRALDGIFFSCATDRPEGFDDAQLAAALDPLPYLALAVKSRLTYDVANTVVETYLGKDAGHRVLTGQIERGSAESIRAVIWFSDLRGFTDLADRLPRRAMIEALDDYLEAMARPLRDNQGQILKFMGDGLLATFDLTGRDEAAVCRDALTAAGELRQAFPALNEARAAAGKPVMDVGLALHLGEVLYGNIGASDRLDFTVVGPAVNEASRIQALCRELDRNVLVSSAFHKAAGGPGALVSLGVQVLRGVRAPQELFTLAD